MSNMLKDELWDAIKNSYLNEDYTTSILNAISYIRDTIREKSNLEQLDGVDLINQAFSEKNPKIKVNSLKTKNDKNIQKGLRELLIGVYTHIRNPRSHDKYKDTKEDAISIILFINYLLKTIDDSKSSFSIDSFIDSIYDEYFVQIEEYAKGLVNEIPNKQLENTFYKLYDSISNNLYCDEDNYGYNDYSEVNYKRIESLKLIISILLNRLTNDKQNILEKISDDLKKMKKNDELFFKLMILFPEWKSLNNLVKLRVIKMLSTWEQYSDVLNFQEKVIEEGWKYFNTQEKESIEKSLINYSKKITIDEDKLTFHEEISLPKQIQQPSLQQSDINIDDDEIPF